jgi:Putative Flp pilus-assembly TadE/G-like
MHGLSMMRLAKLARSNVDRQLSRDGRGRERGAIASIVAIFLGTGVLLGVGALVIDTGSLLYERRQLQSGADATALSIAQTCVEAGLSPQCGAPDISAGSTLVNLAGNNAADQLTNIDSVCASAALNAANPSAFPTICPAPATPGLVECPKSSIAGKYVEVRTSTKTQSGTILPPVLSQMLAGANGQYSNTTVKACARVAWGPAGTSPSLPFAFSACEWKNDTGTGSVYPPPPPYNAANPMNPLWEKNIAVNNINGTDCTWNGHDFAGGFGWLCHSGSCTPPAAATCSITTDGGWVDAMTGNGAGIDCRPQIEAAVGTVVYLPVYDCINPNQNFCPAPVGTEKSTGTHTYYHIQGYAAFFLTAVDDGSIQNHLAGYPTAASKTACAAKGGKCIYGWFLQDLSPVPGTKIDDTAHEFGLLTIQFAG